jgi:xylulokinase
LNQQYILTVDLGTSGPKVSIFDKNCQFIASEFEEMPPIHFYEGGGAEQNPNDWVRCIIKALGRLKQNSLIDFKDIIAINCTAQWSGTLPLDASGNPLMDCMIWMDSRGAGEAKKLMSGFPEIEGYNIRKLYKWISITGGGASKSGKDSISHILWLKAHKPDIYKSTYKFIEPKDYLNYFFTGKIASSFDSATVLWLTDNRNLNDVKYHEDLIRISGIDREKLPDLVPTNSELGFIKENFVNEFGFSPHTKVISGTPDIQSAAVGSGAAGDYEPHLYIGTSSWLVFHMPHKKTDLFHNMGTIPSAIPGKYLLVNEQETTGACLNFMKNSILYANDEIGQLKAPDNFYQLADKLVAKIPAGADGLMFLPWLYGERSPVDDHYLRGGFYNLGLNHSRGHMLRAIYEGVALNIKWLLFYAQKLAGRKFESVNFIGGGANSEIWSQILADVLGIPVKQTVDPLLANSRGAALLALLSLNLIRLEELNKTVSIRKTFEPNPSNRVMYEKRFGIFKEIYKKNKAIHYQLNKNK